MNSKILTYFLIGIGVLFGIVVIAYMILRKKLNTSEAREIQQLRQGTQEKTFSAEILYQKLYVIYLKVWNIKPKGEASQSLAL